MAEAATRPRTVFVVTHEEWLYLAPFLDGVIRAAPSGWIVSGAAIAPKPRWSPSTPDHVLRTVGLEGAGRLAVRAARRALPRIRHPHLRSVHATLRHHGVPVSEIRNPNDAAFVEELSADPPDVILSAVDHYLRPPILEAPRLGCVNRHSGALSAYRGVEPVLHALRHGEPTVTQTFHRMDAQVDAGVVLSEHVEPVRDGDSVHGVLERLFAVAPEQFWDAVAALVAGRGRCADTTSGAHFHAPTADEVAQLRARGFRYA
jgi:methionyl-tRNA formyltransferase